ncbi:tetratricopeptide repeat protein [Stenotrophomonas rhizophila]|uniref:tetratricopeptide repeat protein n=1 Tax=Stenotrophomonas rhizophila TaxID=216778 RepID=UPI0028D35AAD|nr:tetratricopeptide repeat protein [Stenotrophomonas rhizophila]
MRTLTPLLLFGALAATATAATAARPAAIPAMHACTADEADRRRIADDRMETPDDAASMRGTALQEPDGTFAADLVLAQAGDAPAQNRVGHVYATGSGVLRDPDEALRWYQRSAHQGLPAAQSSLAEAHLFGLGTPPDLTRAITLYRQAAAQGHAEAMRRLGDIHAIGGPINRYNRYPAGAQCIAVDLPEAARWYVKAAEAGDAFAQEQLAIAYLAGLGVDPDPVQAERWLEAIGKERRAHAVFYLADQYLYGRGDVVPQDLAKGAHYTLIAAELGHPPGLAQLGALHEYGTGVEQDDVKAYAYALAAHDEGLPIDDHQFTNQVAMFQARMTEAQQAEALQLFRSIRQLLHSEGTYL